MKNKSLKKSHLCGPAAPREAARYRSVKLTLSSLEALLALYHTIYADTLYKHTATHKTLIHTRKTIALYLLSFLLPTQITFLLILSHRLQLALRHLLLVDIDRHIR